MRSNAFTNNCFAVLIGVEDYSEYDASLGNPSGKSDLGGGRNDVCSFFRVCRALGVPPENIRVLTSPRIDDYRDLDGALPDCFALATRDAILATTEWLARKLGDPSRPNGLLTFSGHGAWLDSGDLAFCPSDTSGLELTGAVAFSSLRDILRRHADASNLTIVLDCCHAGAGAGVPSLRDQPPPAGLSASPVEIGRRVLAAAGRDQIALQSRFDERVRGAFSWAISNVLQQWSRVQDGDVVRLDLSYGELVSRATRLLDALGFAQKPVLLGPEGLSDLAVFNKGLDAQAGDTSAEPTGRRPGIQVDGGHKNFKLYRATLPGDVTFQILVTNKASPEGQYSMRFEKDQEYWRCGDRFASGIPADTFSISGTDYNWAGADVEWYIDGLAFPMPKLVPQWTQLEAGREIPAGAFVHEKEGKIALALAWDMRKVDGRWQGSITWYNTSESYVLTGESSYAFTRLTEPRVPESTMYSVTNTYLG